MVKKHGLGRGLDALIPITSKISRLAQHDDNDHVFVQEIPVDRISPNPHQPRREFTSEHLEELKNSIAEHGIIQPLIVVDQGSRHVIVAGERRWRSAKLAGLETVPCIVRAFSELELMEVALIENLQREDLSPMEEAYAYRLLLDDFNLTQVQISQKIGKSRSYVANMVRLLSLSLELQEYVSRGTLSVGHARALLALDDNDGLRQEVAEQIISRHLNVRQTENLIQRLRKVKDVSRETSKKHTHVQALIMREIEEELKSSLGTQVRIKHGEKKGSIEIEYYSEEELQRIITLLKGRS